MNQVHSARNFLDPRGRLAHANARGALVSHLIGFSFFCSFLLTPAFPHNIVMTKLFEWPIRLVALWLLLNRFGKLKSLKFSPWDITHILFAAGFGCALVYAELYMTRDTGFMNYISWANMTLNGYLYFVVVREGLSRRGFSPEILVRWMLGTMFVICLVALAQARDIAGMRHVIDNFYHQAEIEAHMEGPSAPWQARAPATHANSLVIILLCGLPLLLALWDMKRFRWWDGVTLLLMLVTIFMTYSRSGIIALAAAGLGVIVLLTLKKEYSKAATAALTVAGLAVAFAFVVTTFDVGRFKVLFQSPSSVSAMSSKETIGWKLRQERLQQSITLGEKYPVFGVYGASGSLNQEALIRKNAYSYSGLLLNVYAYAFVSYGLVGIAFIGAIFYMLLRQAKFARTRQVFAGTAFVLGIVLIAAGIAENDLFFDGAMITTNIVAAFCTMRVSLPKEERVVPSELKAAA